MRFTRARVLAGSSALLLVGAACWQLLPSTGERRDPITLGTTDVVSALDPAVAYDAGSWALYSNVYQTLLTSRPGSSAPEPDAAESCRFLGHKLQTCQCRLRDDLRFSNGHKVTAQAVKHSFDRVLRINARLGPGPACGSWAGSDNRGARRCRASWTRSRSTAMIGASNSARSS